MYTRQCSEFFIKVGLEVMNNLLIVQMHGWRVLVFLLCSSNIINLEGVDVC
jgi:hypothetical protein